MPSRPAPLLHRAALRRLSALLVAGVLVMAGLVVGTAGSAAANDLAGASPGSGAKLKSAPGQITLTFSDLILGGADVSVQGPDGPVRGNTNTMGRTVTRSLRGDLGSGTYTVSWSVRSLLHEDNGSYSFSVTPKPRPRKTTPKPTPSKTPTPTPTPTRTTAKPTPTATHSPRSTPSTDPAASSDPVPTEAVAAPQVQGVSYTGSGHLPSPVVLWGLLLVAIVVGTIIARVRRNRQ